MIDNRQMIPYGKLTITDSDVQSVINVLKSEYLTQGNQHKLFENKLSRVLDVDFVVSTNSATSALHLACLAVGLSEGDVCWTSPISFVASANCALYCGADIDFVDIDPTTGLMCISSLEQKLVDASHKGKLPKVVIPVHLAGTSCDMEELRKLSQAYGFYIIEDASHAIGGKYKDKSVGSCQYSDLCVFSFHPVKIITTAEGGCVTTNNPSWNQKIRSLRSHGISKDTSEHLSPSSNPWYYEQQSLGFNYRLSDLQSALGLSQLSRLDSIISERQRIYKEYLYHLSSSEITFLTIPDQVLSSLHLAIIRLTDPCPNFHSYIFKKLRDIKIGVQLHYIPIHLHPFYKKLGFKNVSQLEFYSQMQWYPYPRPI